MTAVISPATAALYDEARGYWLSHFETNPEAPLSGKELGAAFGKGERWGRLRADEARDLLRPLAEDGMPLASIMAPPVEDGMPRHTVTRGERLGALASVIVVAVAAAVASFAHQHAVATYAGEGWRAFLFPLSVDGLVVAASALANIRRRAGVRIGALAWLSLILGLSMTVAANVVAASPEVVPLPWLKAIVGAWSPVAFGLASELVREVVAETRR